MSLFIRSFLLLCSMTTSLLLNPGTAEARHIIGGEMTYQFLEKNGTVLRYRITLKLFRDCAGNGPNFDSAPGEHKGDVTMYSGNAPLGYVGTIELPAPAVTKLNPKSFNPCLAIPKNVCVEEGVYTFDVSFTYRATSYWIIYQRCCRNNTINNIYDPLDVGGTYYVEITPESQELKENSPQFEVVPPPVLCVNEYFEYDYSAVDKEGDSLVYRWCSPLEGGGIGNANPSPDAPPPYKNVSYKTPDFSFTDPLGKGILQLSETSGQLSGIPPYQGQFVMGFCVEAYRAGKLLCVVRREFQLNVTLCESVVFARLPAPQDANGVYQLKDCGDKPLTITNASQDQQLINEYEWRFDLDNNKTYETTFSTRNVTFNQPFTGKASGFMVINPKNKSCRDTAYFQLKVIEPIRPAFTYAFDSCAYGPLSLTNITTLPRPVVSANWIFDGFPTNTATSRDLTFDAPGTKNITLQYTDTNGCTYATTRIISWYPLPPTIDFLENAFMGCTPLHIDMDLPGALADSDYDLQWELGDGNQALGANWSHVFIQPGLYDVTLSVKTPIGCQLDTTFRNLVEVYATPLAAFEWKDTGTPISQLNPEVQFINRSENATDWWWTFESGNQINKQHPRYTFRDTGLTSIRLLVLNDNGCADTLIKTLDIVPVVTLYLPNAFTPDQDGLNDTFRPKGMLEGVRNYHCSIFNKWGETVFESSDPNIGWNGLYHNTGTQLPPDVYVCQLFYIPPRGKQVELSTEVLLLR